jgi:hypothetical protein
MTARLAPSNEIRRYCLSKAPVRAPAGAFRRIGAQLAGGFGAAILLFAAPADAENPAAQPAPVAIVDFDYIDAPGEALNQTAKHQALLQVLLQMAEAGHIRRELAF